MRQNHILGRHLYPAAFGTLGFGIQQLEPAAGGKGLRALRELADEAFQDLAAGVGVVPVPDMPGGDEAQPLGPPAVRLVGHLQQQG